MASSTPASPIPEVVSRPNANLIGMIAGSGATIIALLCVVLFVGAALLAPLLFSADSVNLVNLAAARQPPSWAYWLGTDEMGRDMVARLVYGGRITLLVAIASVASSMIVGIAIGALCGFYDNWLSATVMRFMDFMIAFPRTLLAIMVIAVAGPGIVSLTLAIAISTVPLNARLFRGPIMALKQRQFVTAARALGAGDMSILFGHILPNTVSLMIVHGTISLAEAILIASGLSFLGLGPQPPTPEWGAMIAGARGYLTSAPHLIIVPGVALFLVILSFNFLGDVLRDRLDPRMRNNRR
jgi:ABC-type dipeptide/oligopeptide/nickel transport system permease subunit